MEDELVTVLLVPGGVAPDVNVAGADGAVTTSCLQCLHLPLLTPLGPLHDLRASSGC